ncbi:uncharacterized protein PG986_014706 [Apiospora aurea]|uniref:EthD domain-containing protein n=1 Tax=Apiospora aurea TaxID=335848 RepID=A0ABR1PU33_9PEZI
MADSSTYYKFTVTHYRRPEHTHEAFMKWIIEEHLPAAMPIFKKHGVVEYSLVSEVPSQPALAVKDGSKGDHCPYVPTQFETPAPLNSMLKESFSKTRAGWDCADFDCYIEHFLPSVDGADHTLPAENR